MARFTPSKPFNPPHSNNRLVILMEANCSLLGTNWNFTKQHSVRHRGSLVRNVLGSYKRLNRFSSR